MSPLRGRRRAAFPPRRPGSAAALARRTIEWIDAGIACRARGRCGVPAGAEARHRSSGHDAGCAAIGLPLHELRRMLERSDAQPAAALIGEAVAEAVQFVTGRGPDWSAIDTREAVAEALERRITPARTTGTA